MPLWCLKSKVVLLHLEELILIVQYLTLLHCKYTMFLVIRKIIKDQYVFWFWQLSLENWICQRASITTKDDTKTMELTNLVGKKSCYSAQGPRPLSKSKHKVLRTRVCINLWISILVYVMPYNAKIFNWEHILCIKIHACTKRYLIYV